MFVLPTTSINQLFLDPLERKELGHRPDLGHAWSRTPSLWLGSAAAPGGRGPRSGALVQHWRSTPPPSPLGLNERQVALGSQVQSSITLLKIKNTSPRESATSLQEIAT